MKKLFLVTLALLVLTGAGMAKEYVLEVSYAPGEAYLTPDFSPLSETLFSYDDDSTGSYAGWSSYGITIGKQFDGADWGITEGYIVGYELYYYIPGSGTANVILSFYDDEGGWPDSGTQYWTSTEALTGSGWDTYRIDPDTPIYDADANFYGVFAWDTTGEPGGVAVDTSGDTSHDFQDYGGWGAGWYRYYLRAYFNDDVDTPYVDGQDPADGASDVPVDTTIVFHVKDDDFGVDSTTIDFTVQDTTLLPDEHVAVRAGDGSVSPGLTPAGLISGTLDITGDPSDYTCTFTPDAPLPPDTITCTVAAGLADGLGNATTSDIVWTFDTVGSDVEITTWGQIKAVY